MCLRHILLILSVGLATCACSPEPTSPPANSTVQTESTPLGTGTATSEAGGVALKSLDTDRPAYRACREHCTKNHAECRRTANSPEARNECFETFNACTASCEDP